MIRIYTDWAGRPRPYVYYNFCEVVSLILLSIRFAIAVGYPIINTKKALDLTGEVIDGMSLKLRIFKWDAPCFISTDTQLKEFNFDILRTLATVVIFFVHNVS